MQGPPTEKMVSKFKVIGNGWYYRKKRNLLGLKSQNAACTVRILGYRFEVDKERIHAVIGIVNTETEIGFAPPGF
jgi:hypothetical protein